MGGWQWGRREENRGSTWEWQLQHSLNSVRVVHWAIGGKMLSSNVFQNSLVGSFTFDKFWLKTFHMPGSHCTVPLPSLAHDERILTAPHEGWHSTASIAQQPKRRQRWCQELCLEILRPGRVRLTILFSPHPRLLKFHYHRKMTGNK